MNDVPGQDLSGDGDRLLGTSAGCFAGPLPETGGNIAVYEKQMDAAYDLYQRLGIHAIKTGYVADAGGIQALGPDGKIHFEWHMGQVMARHHLKVVTEAAAHHIAIDDHEPIKDTGIRRTYPNWVAREGQRGMEYNAWGAPKNPPEHEANLVFTRMLSGPMDFTPGILSLKGKGDTPILSTLATSKTNSVVDALGHPASTAEHTTAQVDGYQTAFTTGAFLMLAAAAVVILLIRRTDVATIDEGEAVTVPV